MLSLLKILGDSKIILLEILKGHKEVKNSSIGGIIKSLSERILILFRGSETNHNR